MAKSPNPSDPSAEGGSTLTADTGAAEQVQQPQHTGAGAAASTQQILNSPTGSSAGQGHQPRHTGATAPTTQVPSPTGGSQEVEVAAVRGRLRDTSKRIEEIRAAQAAHLLLEQERQAKEEIEYKRQRDNQREEEAREVRERMRRWEEGSSRRAVEEKGSKEEKRGKEKAEKPFSSEIEEEIEMEPRISSRRAVEEKGSKEEKGRFSSVWKPPYASDSDEEEKTTPSRVDPTPAGTIMLTHREHTMVEVAVEKAEQSFLTTVQRLETQMGDITSSFYSNSEETMEEVRKALRDHSTEARKNFKEIGRSLANLRSDMLGMEKEWKQKEAQTQKETQKGFEELRGMILALQESEYLRQKEKGGKDSGKAPTTKSGRESTRGDNIPRNQPKTQGWRYTDEESEESQEDEDPLPQKVEKLIKVMVKQGIPAHTAAAMTMSTVALTSGTRHHQERGRREETERVPRQLTLPKLTIPRSMGSIQFAQGGQLYLDWERSIRNELRAVGLLKVVDGSPPEDMDTDEGTWWTKADSTVFNHLMRVIPTFAHTKFSTLAGTVTSAKDCLRGLKDSYWRPTPYTDFALQREVTDLKPTPKECMEDFLTRTEELNRKCINYGFPVEEATLCRAVTQNLDDSWMEVMDKFGPDSKAWTWQHVSSILLQEDMKRRNFPKGERYPVLGSIPSQGKAFVGFAPPGLKPIKTSSHKGILKSPESPRTSSPGHTPKGPCASCKEFGHGYVNCPKKPYPTWTPTAAEWKTVRSASASPKKGGRSGASSGASSGRSSRASSGRSTPRERSQSTNGRPGRPKDRTQAHPKDTHTTLRKASEQLNRGTRDPESEAA